ncbi:MAG: hypothetical protein HPY50_01785 [Firmicutes bacterium]|nr:hypothetical protein [Bacillota bacterium]
MVKDFGDKVDVKFFDTNKDGIKNSSVEQIISMGYSFPVININGKPRLAGGVNIEKIREIIKEMTA